MNPTLFHPKRFIPNLQINHINVPDFQLSTNGSQIIKAKKIQVNPIKNQPRSLSAHCNFRTIFKIPKSNKENILNPFFPKEKEEDSRHRSQCRVIKEMSQNFENNIRINWVRKVENCERRGERVVPRIRLINVGAECIKRDERKNRDELVTFRPEETPAIREHRFPRDVFCIDSKRKGGLI